MLVAAWALVSWALRFIAAAGSQIRAPRPNQQPLASVLVLGAFAVGTVLIVLEVLALWPSRGPDNHWPLRLLVTWAVVLIPCWRRR